MFPYPRLAVDIGTVRVCWETPVLIGAVRIGEAVQDAAALQEADRSAEAPGRIAIPGMELFPVIPEMVVCIVLRFPLFNSMIN